MDPDSPNKDENTQKPNNNLLRLASDDSDRKCRVPLGPRYQADVPSLPDKDEESQNPNNNWLKLATDNSDRKCRVPLGPRYQADVPAWTDPPNKKEFRIIYFGDTESSCLESMVWSAEDDEIGERVGAGRPNFCACERPGSITCVRTHVYEKRRKLVHELDELFYEWKFNKMGEEFAKLLSKEEREKFEYTIKTNPIFLHGKKPPTERIIGQAFIDYYFNIHIPRRMRSSNYAVNTDDEGGEGEGEGEASSSSSGNEKEVVKKKYLSGRR